MKYSLGVGIIGPAVLPHCSLVATPGRWSPVQAAPSYVQLAAVMTAVSFAAFVLLLGNPPRDPHRRAFTRALTVLILVFVSLMLSTFFYTVMAGEQFCERAFLYEPLAGSVLAIAGLGILLSISWLLVAYDVANRVIRFINLVSIGTGVVAALYVGVAVADAYQAINGASTDQSYVSFAGIGALIFLCGAIYRHSVRNRPKASRPRNDHWFFISIGTCLAFSLSIAILVGVVSEQTTISDLPDSVALLFLTLVGLNFGVLEAQLPFARPRRQNLGRAIPDVGVPRETK